MSSALHLRPSHVAGLSSLTYLRLTDNMLDSLPDGPYLDRLECLLLDENDFNSIPQVQASLNWEEAGGGRREGSKFLLSPYAKIKLRTLVGA